MQFNAKQLDVLAMQRGLRYGTDAESERRSEPHASLHRAGEQGLLAADDNFNLSRSRLQTLGVTTLVMYQIPEKERLRPKKEREHGSYKRGVRM